MSDGGRQNDDDHEGRNNANGQGQDFEQRHMVRMDGTVKEKNGKARKLKNGEMIYVTGKRAKMKH